MLKIFTSKNSDKFLIDSDKDFFDKPCAQINTVPDLIQYLEKFDPTGIKIIENKCINV